MAALENTIKAEDVAAALDIEMLTNFDGEVNRLVEILGIFGVETVAAGTAMYTYTVTGTLNTTPVAEGDETPLSKYDVDKTPIGEIPIKPHRKLTTVQAILKGGFENAVNKTDRKMIGDVRSDILGDFFTYLGTGTGASTGSGLQDALAQADAKLEDTLETNNDSTERIIHFVNRFDIADYLGKAKVTTQTVFGMTYIQSFLGVNDIFVTNRVPKGTLYATPVENLHIYGVDFSTLDDAGLTYTTSDGGLIGVHHAPSYTRTSSETFALAGAMFIAENLSYIVKGSVTEGAPAAAQPVTIQGTPAVTIQGTPNVNATIQGTPAVTIDGQPIQTTSSS